MPFGRALRLNSNEWTNFKLEHYRPVRRLEFPLTDDRLMAAAESYLVPKYQEGSVLGRQGIRKTNQSRLAGAPIHLGNSLRCFYFLAVGESILANRLHAGRVLAWHAGGA